MQVFQLSNYEHNQFPLTAMCANTHKGFPSHSHDFTELVVVLAGEGVHIGDGGERPFQAGDVFVIEPGAVHSYRSEEIFSIVNIMFDAARLRLPDHDVRMLPGYHALFHLEPRARARGGTESLRVDEQDRGRLESLTNALVGELKGRHPGYQSMSAALLTELIVFLSRRVQSVGDAAGSTEAIGKALSRIERCFAEPLSLEDLAQEACMSVRNFQRRFKEAVGVTPFQRLLNVRIGRAKALLRDPLLTVTEVAFMTGFHDSNYFARQFRQLVGCSPRAFRQNTNE